MTGPTHAMHRSVDRLSTGGVRSLEKRRAQLADDALAETELQYQIPISGRASSVAGFSAVTINFEVEFWDAPEQRDNPLDRPHFTYGAELNLIGADNSDAASQAGLAVTAFVRDWVRDDRDAYTGAVVSVAVWSPGGGAVWDFEGLLHVRFQGWGAISEDSEISLDAGQS